MVELKSAIIVSNEAPNEKIDIVFSQGIYSLSFAKKYLFDFLLLRNQALEEGRFFINGKKFFPQEEETERIVVMLIRSKIFVFAVCFVTSPKTNKLIDGLQNELLASRLLPLETNQNRIDKIIATIKIIQKTNPAYFLLDWNNPINDSHREVLKQTIPWISSSETLICLEKNPNIKDQEALETVIHDYQEDDEDEIYQIDIASGTIERKKQSTKSKLFQQKELFGKVFRANIVSYLLLFVSIAYMIVFMSIAPYYITTGDIAFGVFLILSCVLFSIIAYFVTIMSFNFINSAKSNRKILRIIALVYSYASILLAIIVGVIIFLALGTNTVLFNIENYKFAQAFAAIFIAIIHLLIPFFYSQLQKVNQKIKSFFIKKNK